MWYTEIVRRADSERNVWCGRYGRNKMIINVILAVVFIIGLVLLWVCVYDSSRFVVVRYQIKNEKIKSSYRAVVLADLHNKKFGKDNRLLLEEIEKCEPDGIWIAGDILTAVPGESLDTALAFVGALAEKYPVFYGNGNHEHRLKLYPETYGDMAEKYEEGLAKIGVSPMINVKREIAEHNITVYGAEIDREYYERFKIVPMEETYLKELLGETTADKFTVLLAHNPDYFPAYAEWGADLVLSGHVHGGMVRIPGWKGVVSPRVSFFPKYDGGKFVHGSSTMILSRGLGMHTIPIRLFNPAEVVVVELEGVENGVTG